MSYVNVINMEKELGKDNFKYNFLSFEVLYSVWVKTEAEVTSLKCRKRRKQKKCYFEPCNFWVKMNSESEVGFICIHLEY